MSKLTKIPPPPLLDISLKILNNPEFKEDSVREVIIAPILKSLGYSNEKPNLIIRSRSLKHPFVYIGSKKSPVNIIPDYILEIDGHNLLVLDAKSPIENIQSGKNPEQAFSYAIHKDIRCENYALCNGYQLSMFSIHEYEPIKSFNILEIDSQWEDIYKTFSPMAFSNPNTFEFHLDLGLAFKSSGHTEDRTFHFLGLPIDHLVQIYPDVYTTLKNTTIDGIEYAASYDMSWPVVQSIMEKLPNDIQLKILTPLLKYPFQSFFGDQIFYIDVVTELSESIEINNDEQYVPFIVKSAKLSSDITGFKLRHPEGSQEPKR